MKVVSVGRVSGVHGIKGWIKVHSYTDPIDNIAQFRRWALTGPAPAAQRIIDVEASRRSGRHVLAKLDGIDSRDAAADLIGAEISVPRAELPECEAGKYYWVDLIGLEVRNLQGERLGCVERLIETGEHDVLVVAGGPGRMIPFVVGRTVHAVDLRAGLITVDWEAAYWKL